MGIEPGHRQTPDDQSATTTPTPRWWVAEGLRDDLCAVFEGGGAKGVAHAGAAWAVHGRGHWFRAVAGASAGAITAALVAAGATPAQLDAWTPEGLAALADDLVPPAGGRRARGRFWWRTLRQLSSRGTAAVADGAALERWLRGRLADLTGDPDMTFRALHQRTGIELTVVAVDIQQRRHRIFCHSWSPGVEVADAVVASSSIPFVLPAKHLATSADERYGYPIVDGGVWTNFPRFVFDDAQFRRHHGLGEVGGTVVGFLLDEDGQRSYDPERERPCRFGPLLGRLDQGGDGLRPAELLLSYTHDEIEHVLATRRVAGTVRVAGAAPYLLDVLSDTSAVAAFRTTRRPLAEPARSAVDALERRSRPGLGLLLQGMSTLANPFVALAMVAASAVSAAVIARWAFAARPGGVWVIAWVLALVVLLTVLAAATVLYAVLVTANVALHWPTRKYGTLVARAYAAASGAPYWSGRPGDGPDDGVIRLPIPPWATTLAFDLDETRRRDLIGTARRVTTERLAVLLPGTE